ncbi:4-keto-6-deoxy-N-acetyl-D-hexosaminyl-(lipid carrier) aminotransferase [Buttiauxella ferragutiae ATCC 51602]|uniref:4-keto-6-deoxy-N-acetyl-D-hexosaminyl-(Lipid carrier) aminotransferase n=1 Tax=Buttiauxella ferragutiae ATCC 51602 TaxID=1354252 RepID=A0ABX2W9T3_9ENTR|nr:LegC family aminotransferase [Buttiauxella ferragutiae]OAT28123.1 4-keto-6-deoxy-N-acetyl-D-hexosaminyl-(lipid carrier) aminotransferase [Buttiauxella ferragutiae ATCC 51602]
MQSTQLVAFIRDIYKTNAFIPLHAPTFSEKEQANVADTLESTFVSSVGKYVDEFERKIEAYTGSARAVATVNGTAALHAALHQAGVERGDLVITQALTFVATCNTLYHMGAQPVLVDVAKTSLSLCPEAVEAYLYEHAKLTGQGCYHKGTGQRIKAVLPMHTFGHPAELDELLLLCKQWGLTLVEDAAESLGSFYKGKHTGTVGEFAALSFNGNKIITTGGGGMVLCQTATQGDHIKHVTTTAKVPHPYEFHHDEAGFNYRLPNLNAALGCAQMEALPTFLKQKRALAQHYAEFFRKHDCQFVLEPSYARSNYWLNAIICESEVQRDALLTETNAAGVMTRPVWKLMHRLPMFSHAHRGDLTVSEWLESRVINLPSSPVEV